MRWIFLAFIALLAVVGNAAIFERLSMGRVIGSIAFNLFIASLLLVWWASYFATTGTKGRLLVIGHALIMLSAGFGLMVLGTNVFLSGSCEIFLSSRKPEGLRSQLMAFIQSQGYCSELGLGIAMLGLIMAYPSIRLFAGITRRPAVTEHH